MTGGMYFILDRFEDLSKPFTSLWNWQERAARIKSNKTFERYK
jgi:hypothetical protein